jgi:hypothetical protein
LVHLPEWKLGGEVCLVRKREAFGKRSVDRREEIARLRRPALIAHRRSFRHPLPSGTVETAPARRDRHLQLIAERGRMGWQKASGYNWRALV